METYYYRNFLNYIHIWNEYNRSHNVIGDKMPQEDILWHQIKFPVG